MSNWQEKFICSGGALNRFGKGFFIFNVEGFDIREKPHSTFLTWKDESFTFLEATEWNTAGIVASVENQDEMIAVGELGYILITGGNRTVHEYIISENVSLENLGILRAVKIIGNRVYAAGMNRQVYRRERNGSWSSLVNGLEPEKSEMTGFEAIDGFSENDIVTVGWNGEIYRYNGDIWRRIESPTNLILTDVCCTQDGHVYACGQNGILVHGYYDEWVIIDHEGTDQDFWGLAWFKGALYLSTLGALYVLANGSLKLVDTSETRASTFRNFTANEDTLWSIGAKDIIKFDGNNWNTIDTEGNRKN